MLTKCAVERKKDFGYFTGYWSCTNIHWVVIVCFVSMESTTGGKTEENLQLKTLDY